jgi:peptide/nickel transport system substrate-binding protein
VPLACRLQVQADAVSPAFELHAADIGHIPLHQQALAWAMKKTVSVVQLADNQMPYNWVTVK